MTIRGGGEPPPHGYAVVLAREGKPDQIIGDDLKASDVLSAHCP